MLALRQQLHVYKQMHLSLNFVLNRFYVALDGGSIKEANGCSLPL